MKLALGTVQFGLAYGITGRGAVVPEQEVREILVAAADQGVSVLDTAVAYGDIEPRLAGLCAGFHDCFQNSFPSPFACRGRSRTMGCRFGTEIAA